MSSSLRLMFLAVALTGAACKSHGDTSVDEANAAAKAAQSANQDLDKSRVELAQKSATGAVAVGDDVATKARADALFVDQRNTVLSEGRSAIRVIDDQIANLKTRGSTAAEPAKLQTALDAVVAAKGVAGVQIEQLAAATPETWESRRKAMEASLATLVTSYDTAAAAAAPR